MPGGEASQRCRDSTQQRPLEGAATYSLRLKKTNTTLDCFLKWRVGFQNSSVSSMTNKTVQSPIVRCCRSGTKRTKKG